MKGLFNILTPNITILQDNAGKEMRKLQANVSLLLHNAGLASAADSADSPLRQFQRKDKSTPSLKEGNLTEEGQWADLQSVVKQALEMVLDQRLEVLAASIIHPMRAELRNLKTVLGNSIAQGSCGTGQSSQAIPQFEGSGQSQPMRNVVLGRPPQERYKGPQTLNQLASGAASKASLNDGGHSISDKITLQQKYPLAPGQQQLKTLHENPDVPNQVTEQSSLKKVFVPTLQISKALGHMASSGRGVKTAVTAPARVISAGTVQYNCKDKSASNQAKQQSSSCKAHVPRTVGALGGRDHVNRWETWSCEKFDTAFHSPSGQVNNSSVPDTDRSGPSRVQLPVLIAEPSLWSSAPPP